MASKRRGLPEINAGSMADIAFLLLIFFLVTTTMEVDSGILRKLPPWPEKDVETPDIHKRNIFVVLINKNDKILSGIGSATKKVEVYKNGNISSSLKDDIKKFVNNKGDVNGDGVFDNRPGSDMNSSDSPQEAVVSLQNAKKTKYKTYILVQNELTKAYNELRNEKSILEYGKEFGLLDSDKQNTIKNYYPMNISEADIKKEDDE